MMLMMMMVMMMMLFCCWTLDRSIGHYLYLSWTTVFIASFCCSGVLWRGVVILCVVPLIGRSSAEWWHTDGGRTDDRAADVSVQLPDPVATRSPSLHPAAHGLSWSQPSGFVLALLLCSLFTAHVTAMPNFAAWLQVFVMATCPRWHSAVQRLGLNPQSSIASPTP